MATVELSFTPLPAHVRTARLVATAVARRSRVAESLLDEVRLAVGEACSRAVEAHRAYCPAEPVRIRLSDGGGRFEVVVTDTAPSGPDDRAAARAREPAQAATRRGDRHASAAGPAGEPAVSTGGAAEPAPGEETPGTQAHRTPLRGTRPAGAPAAQAAAAAAAPESGSGTAGHVAADPAASPADSAVNGGLPADIGLAVIEGLADDVHISATPRGVTIRMSWPVQPAA